MQRGRPKAPLTLSDEERETLQHWAAGAGGPASLGGRARILLACASGETNKAIAHAFGATPQTVGKWRARFLRQRLDGLLDEPRTGAPRRILDDDIQRVITLTVESLGPGDRPWSTRSLAHVTGLSQSAISRIWRAHGLRPYRGENTRFWHDPHFVEQVQGLAGVYADPPTHALALCLGVGSPQSVALVPEGRPHGAGGGEARHIWRSSPLAALRLPQGRLRSVQERRARAKQFRSFLDTLDASVPRDRRVCVLVARDGTFESSLVQSWFAGHPRFEGQLIAPRTSFDDLLERWLAVLGTREQADGAASFREVFEEAIERHEAESGGEPSPFVWVRSPRGYTQPDVREGGAHHKARA